VTDLEEKKLTVVIPMSTYLRAVAKMGPLRFKFQGLLLRLLQQWVDESVGGEGQPDSHGSRVSATKDVLAVEQFRSFLKEAPKEDVHIVLSLIARFSGSSKENALNLPERKAVSR
jgi:hypothetical protein